MSMEIQSKNPIIKKEDAEQKKPVDEGISFKEAENSIFTNKDYASIMNRADVADIIAKSDTDGNKKINDQELEQITKTVQEKYEAAVSGMNKTGNVNSAANVQQINQPTIKDYENSVQEKELKKDLDAIKSAGYDISITGDGVLELKGDDGKTGTITINIDGSLSLTGCANEALEKALAKSKEKDETNNLKQNLNKVLDKYDAQGFYPVGTPEAKDDKLIGTLKNDKGEEIKIDLKTGQEIQD